MWHRGNAPAVVPNLLPGATKEELEALETAIGCRLPDHGHASYTLYNGMEGDPLDPADPWFMDHGALLPLAEVRKYWDDFRTYAAGPDWPTGENFSTEYIEGPILPESWNPARIPLICRDSDFLQVDLTPAEGGAVGQIIYWSHEVGPTMVLASSWREWLQKNAEALEQGDYVYSEKYGSVRPISSPNQ